MKNARMLLLILSLLLAGCASLRQRIAVRSAMLTLAQLAPRTEGRWPMRTEEIEEGLKATHRKPRYLSGVKNLALTPNENDLIVSYTSYDDARMEFRLGGPQTKKANQSVQPVTPRANE
jgi:hypothetical protein